MKFITMKSARGHSYRACELALEQLASKRFPLEQVDDAPVRAQGRGPGDQVGRRRGRAGRDSRLADAVDANVIEAQTQNRHAHRRPRRHRTRRSASRPRSIRGAGGLRSDPGQRPGLLERHAEACGIAAELQWSRGSPTRTGRAPAQRARLPAAGDADLASARPARGRPRLDRVLRAPRSRRRSRARSTPWWRRRRTKRRSRWPASNSTAIPHSSRARPAPARTTSS